MMDLVRFWSRAQIQPAGCWVWGGTLNEDGYGIYSRRKAHRVALGCAEDLLPGLVVDHLCGNRACVNPLHLEQVTQSENARRSNGPRSWVCPHGHDVRVHGRNSSYLCRECARIKSRARRASALG